MLSTHCKSVFKGIEIPAIQPYIFKIRRNIPFSDDLILSDTSSLSTVTGALEKQSAHPIFPKAANQAIFINANAQAFGLRVKKNTYFTSDFKSVKARL